MSRKLSSKYTSTAIFTALMLASCATLSKPVANSSKELSVQQLIKEGRNAEAKEMFATKAAVDMADEDRNTALHIAAKYNDS